MPRFASWRQLEIYLRHAIAHGGPRGLLPALPQPEGTTASPSAKRWCAGVIPSAAWCHRPSSSRSPKTPALSRDRRMGTGDPPADDAATWPDDIRLAVNVSHGAIQERHAGAEDRGGLAASNLPASRLELEITEAVLIRDDYNCACDPASAPRHRRAHRARRFSATGYSSLSYLHRFPFDKIKIDRCFVSDIAGPDGSASIVQAVVSLASARAWPPQPRASRPRSSSACCARSAAPRCRAICSAPQSPPIRCWELFALHRSRLAQRDGNENRRREAG